MENIQVGRSRIKTLLIILGAIGFVAAGIWMVQNPDIHLTEKIVGGIGILFFGAAIPMGIKKLISNENALELTNSSLIIEPNSNNTYALPWDIIISFDEIKIKGAKLIAIKVSNPQEWIDKEPNLIKRKMLQFNLSNYGTPFNVTSSGLNISHGKLLELLHKFHNEVT